MSELASESSAMSVLARTSRWPWLVLVALLAGGLVVATFGDSGIRTSDERARGLAETIKCPTCQGQSVADSSSPAAKNIRTEIVRRMSVDRPIAMGYVDAALAVPGTRVRAIVRGKPVPMEVATLPFVPARYFRG